MNILISLRSELVKNRRTTIWYLCLVCALLTVLYAYLLNVQPEKLEQFKQDPWNSVLVGQGSMVLNVMLLPFFIILVCTLQAQLEFKNNTWKQVYASPQPLWSIFLAKFLNIQLVIIGVILLSNILMGILVLVVHNFNIPLDLNTHNLDWEKLFIFNGRIYITLMGMSTFQFWLGLRFKNFIVPIVIGLCLWIAGMMMVEENVWAHDTKYPYIYPMRNYFPRLPDDRTTIIWGSLVYTGLFLVLGFIDFKRRGVKH